ncbi:MAG: hypothetical protein D6696_12555 [Acidobacteria bacterium]|nr:MAG: hypothetical protein D6696_12555 [Acidobacteriota bacterium]
MTVALLIGLGLLLSTALYAEAAGEVDPPAQPAPAAASGAGAQQALPTDGQGDGMLLSTASCYAYRSCGSGTPISCSCPGGGTCSDGPGGQGGGFVDCDCLDGTSYYATCSCTAIVSCIKTNPGCDVACTAQPGTPGACQEGFDQVTCNGVTTTCADVNPNRCI